MVSIILPVYNVENNIRNMLQDIISQSYSDFEVIIINDGSTDATGVYCQECKDSRIIYIDTKNHGPSHARNIGIDRAHGKYITFLDADDRVDSNHIELMVDILEHGGVELVTSRTNINNTFSMVEIVDMEVAKYRIMNGNMYGGYLWNKMFLTNTIKRNDIRFKDEFWVCEDLVFTLTYLTYCSKIAFMNSCTYYYKLGQGISSSFINPHKLTEVYARRYIRKKLVTPEEDSYELAVRHSVTYCVRYYIKLCRLNVDERDVYEKYKKAMLDEINECNLYYLYHCKIEVKYKIACVIISLFASRYN